ncbi:MAG: 23S rRNA pseudouridine(955/2504/2580) synthase RluC [Candidatus Thiodiazotropha sp.]
MSESKKNSPTVQFVDVASEFAGQRIDNFLLRQIKGAPKSYIYRVLRTGEVRVNKGRVKAQYKLQSGDRIRIPPVRLEARSDNPIPESLQARLRDAIVFEDERFLVLNKPSGIAVHGGSGVSVGVIETLRHMMPDERQLELVHRLDRDTSGCLMISKRRSALRVLHELMRENRVDKRYLALVAGSWRKGVKRVDQPLKINTLQGGERIVRVDQEGRPSQTVFRRLERFTIATLVEAELLTGRTHQIRVHSAWLGSPVLGDQKYGDSELNKTMKNKGLRRLFLHAYQLKLRWPGEGRERVIQAPLPSELQQVLDNLKNSHEV